MFKPGTEPTKINYDHKTFDSEQKKEKKGKWNIKAKVKDCVQNDI